MWIKKSNSLGPNNPSTCSGKFSLSRPRARSTTSLVWHKRIVSHDTQQSSWNIFRPCPTGMSETRCSHFCADAVSVTRVKWRMYIRWTIAEHSTNHSGNVCDGLTRPTVSRCNSKDDDDDDDDDNNNNNNNNDNNNNKQQQQAQPLQRDRATHNVGWILANYCTVVRNVTFVKACSKRINIYIYKAAASVCLFVCFPDFSKTCGPISMKLFTVHRDHRQTWTD